MGCGVQIHALPVSELITMIFLSCENSNGYDILLAMIPCAFPCHVSHPSFDKGCTQTHTHTHMHMRLHMIMRMLVCAFDRYAVFEKDRKKRFTRGWI
jgi:hypothetical protein